MNTVLFITFICINELWQLVTNCSEYKKKSHTEIVEIKGTAFKFPDVNYLNKTILWWQDSDHGSTV